jgi:hypothetical protein
MLPKPAFVTVLTGFANLVWLIGLKNSLRAKRNNVTWAVVREITALTPFRPHGHNVFTLRDDHFTMRTTYKL